MWAVYVVYTAYLLLSYPRGRLESGLERGSVSPRIRLLRGGELDRDG